MKCWQCSFDKKESIELMEKTDLCENHKRSYGFHKKEENMIENALLDRRFIKAQEQQYREGIL